MAVFFLLISCVVKPAYSIFVYVDGDLFLDYSVFSQTQDLTIVGDVTIIGETIHIFSYEQAPTMPDLSMTATLLNPSPSINVNGDLLLYSDNPITNGVFESTNTVFIGNYYAIKPVPLPAAAWLFCFGLIGLVGIVRKKAA